MSGISFDPKKGRFESSRKCTESSGVDLVPTRLMLNFPSLKKKKRRRSRCGLCSGCKSDKCPSDDKCILCLQSNKGCIKKFCKYMSYDNKFRKKNKNSVIRGDNRCSRDLFGDWPTELPPLNATSRLPVPFVHVQDDNTSDDSILVVAQLPEPDVHDAPLQSPMRNAPDMVLPTGSNGRFPLDTSPPWPVLIDSVPPEASSLPPAQEVFVEIQNMLHSLKSLHTKVSNIEDKICNTQLGLNDVATRTSLNPVTMPLATVVRVPTWGAFVEKSAMDFPLDTLHLLPEWQHRRKEDPVQFTKERCDPSISISLSHSAAARFRHPLEHPHELSSTLDGVDMGPFTLQLLDRKSKRYLEYLNQSATILFLTFRTSRRSYFIDLMKRADITTIIAVDDTEHTVGSVCVTHTVDFDTVHCSGFVLNESAFVTCVLYMATSKPHRKQGLASRIIASIKARVDKVVGSILFLHSAYDAVGFWKKHASHTRVAINMSLALYTLDPTIFDICCDTLELVYCSV